jgi:SAM-dependent methyltransferase
MIGIDVHLNALLIAKRLASQRCAEQLPFFVLADARRPPFREGVFAGVFSYSVIQHFGEDMAEAVLCQIQKMLRKDGRALIQMPNRAGVRSLVNISRRGFQHAREFDVRYYSIGALVRMFESTIGPTKWKPDCFLGLNVHSWDRKLVSPSRRIVVDVAETLLSTTRYIPALSRFADSVWLESTRGSTC